MLEINELRTKLIGPISLKVARGECVAVCGPSGSGKSLFLRAVVDLDPNEGKLLLKGQDRDLMTADCWRRHVAMIPAESGWWTDFVADHFEADYPAKALLDALDLPDALDWRVSRLSSGERQRLAIVRALSLSPDSILLDEPTSALDEAATSRVEDVIRAQCSRGAAVILVTHDLAQARRLASRRFVMEHGLLKPEVEDPK